MILMTIALDSRAVISQRHARTEQFGLLIGIIAIAFVVARRRIFGVMLTKRQRELPQPTRRDLAGSTDRCEAMREAGATIRALVMFL